MFFIAIVITAVLFTAIILKDMRNETGYLDNNFNTL